MNRYSNIKTEKLNSDFLRSKGKNIFSKTPKYPEIEFDSNDIYIITEFGDNFPALANQFYNDETLYWIIPSANPNDVSFGSIYINPGTQIRIPANINKIIDNYNKLNSL